MNKSIRVGILGAGGFTGQELIRIFAHHSAVELVYLTSSEYAAKKLSAAFPALAAPAFDNLKFSPHPKTVADAPQLDAVFLATPDDVALAWAPQFLAAGVRVIDISGAFRLTNTTQFQEYYGLEHNQPSALGEAIYGLSEVDRKSVV